MYDFYVRNKKDIIKTSVFLGFIAFVYIFVTYLFTYIAPFVFAFGLSLLLEPPVSFLNKKFKIHRGLLSLFFVIVTTTIITLLGTRILINISNQAFSFIRNFPTLIMELKTTIDSLMGNLQHIVELVPVEFHSTIDSFFNSFALSATSFVSSIVRGGSGSFVRAVPQAFTSILLCIISAFFFIKDRHVISKTVVSITHPAIINSYGLIKKGLFDALVGYIRAQLIIMTFTAIISITGLTIMGYPYALFVGLILAFLDALPIVGTGSILWPWAAFCLITGDYSMSVGLIIVYGVITVTRQSLEPKVLAEQIGIHPLITLMSIYIGLKIFGVLGFFIGPVIVVTIKALNDSDVFK